MSKTYSSYNKSGWLADTTRIAIYCRDGHECVYCGHKVGEERTYINYKKVEVTRPLVLSVDHIKPQSKTQGANKPTNLITCCGWCNSQKGTMSMADFMRYIQAVPLWDGRTRTADEVAEIKRNLKNKSRRKLPRVQARGFHKALKNNHIAIARALGNI